MLARTLDGNFPGEREGDGVSNMCSNFYRQNE